MAAIIKNPRPELKPAGRLTPAPKPAVGIKPPFTGNFTAGPAMRPMPAGKPGSTPPSPRPYTGPDVSVVKPKQPAGGGPGAVSAKGPKPQGEGESAESYAKRSANWNKSQERLKAVGITGGVNKATPEQLEAFKEKYGRTPSGLKPPAESAKPEERRRYGMARGAREALGGRNA